MFDNVLGNSWLADVAINRSKDTLRIIAYHGVPDLDAFDRQDRAAPRSLRRRRRSDRPQLARWGRMSSAGRPCGSHSTMGSTRR